MTSTPSTSPNSQPPGRTRTSFVSVPVIRNGKLHGGLLVPPWLRGDFLLVFDAGVAQWFRALARPHNRIAKNPLPALLADRGSQQTESLLLFLQIPNSPLSQLTHIGTHNFTLGASWLSFLASSFVVAYLVIARAVGVLRNRDRQVLALIAVGCGHSFAGELVRELAAQVRRGAGDCHRDHFQTVLRSGVPRCKGDAVPQV